MARLTGTAPKRVGLILGREWSFPPALIEEVAKRDEGVTVEYARIGATLMDQPCPYDVVIDRISHEVPFYRTWLKKALLDGATVVNNPFMWSADDKFFGAALATKLGVASPKTVALPNKSYVPGIVPSESLRNLEYPLDWEGLVRDIGMPCILKDAHGGGWKEVYVCRSLDELLHHYDRSGLLTMVVQEFIQWEQFVRCLCIGQEEILPMQYDPRERKYLVEPSYLTPELEAAHHGGCAHPGAGAGLRHELDRVRHPGRHPLRDRLHEPRAGHGHLLAHADLLRVDRAGDGRHGHPAGEEAASPVARAQVGRRVHRRALGAIPCRRRSPTTTSC